jgi:DNA-3-methyladenine glycosylase II
MATITITPRGPFSLAASGAFLEGFAPARYPGNAPDGAIRLAFPADDGRATIGAGPPGRPWPSGPLGRQKLRVAG